MISAARVVEEGIRKVDLWTARHRLVTVPFADQPVDPFFNRQPARGFEAAAALLRAAGGGLSRVFLRDGRSRSRTFAMTHQGLRTRLRPRRLAPEGRVEWTRLHRSSLAAVFRRHRRRGSARSLIASSIRAYQRYSARACAMKLIGPIAAINNGTEAACR